MCVNAITTSNKRATSTNNAIAQKNQLRKDIKNSKSVHFWNFSFSSAEIDTQAIKKWIEYICTHTAWVTKVRLFRLCSSYTKKGRKNCSDEHIYEQLNAQNTTQAIYYSRTLCIWPLIGELKKIAYHSHSIFHYL